MRSRMKIGLVLAVVMVGVFHWTQLVSWAQESADDAPRKEFVLEVFDDADLAARRASNQAREAERVIRSFHVRKEPGGAIHKAAMAVNESEGEEAKESAEAKLNELLAQYFDDDMTRREEELVKIEERLLKLKALLDLRREKKEEIIDLQSKVALNEAAGLGFYGNDSSGGMPSTFHFETKLPHFGPRDAPRYPGMSLPPAAPGAPPAPPSGGSARTIAPK